MKTKALLLALVGALTLTSVPTSKLRADTSEQHCLALNIYYEARGATQVDKEAVGHVTLNRVKYNFAKTICGVVYQRGQFSWTADKNSHVIRNPQAWEESQDIADDLLSADQEDAPEDLTDGATYFYDHNRVHPKWVHKMVVTFKTATQTYLKRKVDILADAG
jgi:N-acetylmuramoyl-L-alanine amidase